MSDRRQLLTALAGAGALASWSKPSVTAAILPAHANTSPACANAVRVGCGSVYFGSTDGGNDFRFLGDCGTTNTSEEGVLHHFVGNGETIRFSTCNQADFDTKISVWSSDDCVSFNCENGDDDSPGCAGFTTETLVQTEFGRDYYILVHGFGLQSGNYTLSVDCPDIISDARLKTDVSLLATAPNGLPLYRFRYLGDASSQSYVGVMAQDVLTVDPGAVNVDHRGFYKVRYGRLGLRMNTIEAYDERGLEAVIAAS